MSQESRTIQRIIRELLSEAPMLESNKAPQTLR